MLCTQPTGRIYVEMTPEQCYLSLQLCTKLPGSFGWDKHPIDHLQDQQVEEWDKGREDYIRRWPSQKRGHGIFGKKGGKRKNTLYLDKT